MIKPVSEFFYCCHVFNQTKYIWLAHVKKNKNNSNTLCYWLYLQNYVPSFESPVLKGKTCHLAVQTYHLNLPRHSCGLFSSPNSTNHCSFKSLINETTFAYCSLSSMKCQQGAAQRAYSPYSVQWAAGATVYI